MLIIQEILGYFFIGIIGMAILAVCYLPIYFYYEKKNAVIKANCLFSVCRLRFSYLYRNNFRRDNCSLFRRQGNTCYRTFIKSYTFSICHRNLGYGDTETNYTVNSKYINVFAFRFYIPCCIQESSYLL